MFHPRFPPGYPLPERDGLVSSIVPGECRYPYNLRKQLAPLALPPGLETYCGASDFPPDVSSNEITPVSGRGGVDPEQERLGSFSMLSSPAIGCSFSTPSSPITPASEHSHTSSQGHLILPSKDTMAQQIHISGLPQSSTEAFLYEACAKIGISRTDIDYVKPIFNSGRACVGYGFVQFTSPAVADHALRALGEAYPELSVNRAKVSKQHESFIAMLNSNSDPTNCNLYICNIPLSWDNNDLLSLASRYGRVCQAKVLEKNGRSRGIGFAEFATRTQAELALRSLDGYKPDEAANPLSVRFADTPSQKRIRQRQIKIRQASDVRNDRRGVASGSSSSAPVEGEMGSS
ncbi:RNA recognition motif-containing protein [Giardia muris]|uniref:RNA recognition motif-containing protein n=1 Tax=Giardia muris TaxID=5742 RepID=A0A4Z1T1E3_GIAMU|nr:RNA recognition motif-containing protein [Giardia muris]|eukprot:TNJ26757.1 RNA recognition motif-containing protein [Giardia muris]